MVPKNKPGEALNADAITEILRRLPAKSVGRFRCVSKLWLSLLSDPRFLLSHAAAAPAETSGFYVYDPDHRQAEFFSLNGGGGGHPDPTLWFLDHRGIPPKPLDSCNGLLLCSSLLLSVCNPTTREHDVVPSPCGIPCGIIESSARLAFDPRSSPNYMIFAVVWTGGPEGKRMHKYTSETRSWKILDVPALMLTRFPTLVYWKGSLVQYDPETLVALDVESEQIHAIPLPSPRPMYNFLHLGTSGDRLHFIRGVNYARFEILEMASVSSGWHVLHSVDLASTVERITLMVPVYQQHVEFIRGDQDRLLLQVRGKVVSFNLSQNTFTTICQFGRAPFGLPLFPLDHCLIPLIVNRIDLLPSHEWVCWKSEHDQLLISLMVEQSRNGKRMENGFQTDAWHEMVRTFNRATGMNYDVLHLENRLKSYRREYQIVKEILAIDGFRWDASEKVVNASNTRWHKIRMKNPQAILYKRKNVPFEALKIMCASSIRIDNKVSQNTCRRKRKGRHD